VLLGGLRLVGTVVEPEFTDADRRLTMCDSHFRGAQLLRELQDEPDDIVAADLLAEWWNMCDAFKPSAAGLREQLLRVGFVTDHPEVPPPALPVTVYRGAWDDDDPATALSWTLSREIAERFAHGLVGMRAKLIFGIDRPDNDPMIWQATCTEMLGWITGRGEQEVIVGKISDAAPIAQLLRRRTTSD